MNIYDIIIEMLAQTWQILEGLWNLDMSVLAKKHFGIRIIDIIALYIALIVLKELARFFSSFLTKVLSSAIFFFTRIIINYAWNTVFHLFAVVLKRSFLTLRYLLGQELIQIFWYRFVIYFETVTAFAHPGK